AADKADAKAANAQAAADKADAKAANAQAAADKATEAATTKSEAARDAAVEKAGKQADTKIQTAKEEIAKDITAAKDDAIKKAGENTETKVTAATTALETKLQGLNDTTVKLVKYDKDIAALQETDKNHEARLTTVEQDVKVVGANAAALAALKPLQYNPGQTTQVMAGVGTYRGKTAVALGAAHYASENLMYHAGVSFGNGNGAMANAGVTIGFGSGEGAKMNSSKVAELQSAVDRLTAENEQVKAALYDIYAKLQAK
ncbi:MAG: YadA C-terminal domain-containing protein, partial [Veillonella sp. oral taxon 780]|nr:YadA C-terminal domain-containing protein [Veillonella sp. oral taxon 780]